MLAWNVFICTHRNATFSHHICTCAHLNGSRITHALGHHHRLLGGEQTLEEVEDVALLGGEGHRSEEPGYAGDHVWLYVELACLCVHVCVCVCVLKMHVDLVKTSNGQLCTTHFGIVAECAQELCHGLLQLDLWTRECGIAEIQYEQLQFVSLYLHLPTHILVFVATYKGTRWYKQVHVPCY